MKTKTTTEHIVGARKWAWRRKTASQHEGLARQLCRETRYGIGINPDATVETACWTIGVEKGRYCHLIKIRQDFPSIMGKDAAGDERRRAEMARSLARHELWHGLATGRTKADLDSLMSAIKTSGLPFMVCNLMEDSRIEHQARTTDERGLFGWRRLVDVAEKTSEPHAYYYSLNHCEMSHWKGNPTRSTWTGSKADKAFIEKCYDRAVNAANAQEILPIVKDWVDRFGAMYDAPHVMVQPEICGERDPRATPPRTAPSLDADPTTENGACPETYTDYRDARPFIARDQKYAPVTTQADADAIARRLAPILMPRRRTGRIAVQGRRLYARGAMVGAAESFRTDGTPPGRPRMCIVMDMSGSMMDVYMNQGAAFIRAIAQLHRRNVIHADLWLSMVDGDREHRCHKVDIHHAGADAYIKSIAAQGSGEGIRATLERYARADVIAANVTVVYTDGCIGGGQVDAQHWRRQGADVIGAMTACAKAAPHYQAKMAEHFGRFIIRPTAGELAGEIARYCAQRAATRTR